MNKRLFAALFMAFVTATSAAAQGTQTGVVTGKVQSGDGFTLPGVTVSVTSPALQGERSTVTDVNGVYLVRGLPPGVYTVRFALESFQSASMGEVVLELGGVAEVNTIMQLAARTEVVTVTASSPNPLATVTTSQAFIKRDLDRLPVTRRPQDIAELAPGLTNNTPNASQVTISGGFAYDNVFLVDGVDVDDNLFAQPNNLYVEDAIEETNVLVGGISAEYGRFTGGVVNVITKAGGNNFSGTFRENFAKPSWIATTPREDANNITHSTVLSKFYEGTAGGRIQADRLWFFTAGRYESSDTPGTFVQVAGGGGYTTHNLNKRGQIKLTGTLAPNQMISGSYLKTANANQNLPSLNASAELDPTGLINRQTPTDLAVVNYNGVIGRKIF